MAIDTWVTGNIDQSVNTIPNYPMDNLHHTIQHAATPGGDLTLSWDSTTVLTYSLLMSLVRQAMDQAQGDFPNADFPS